MTGVTINYEPAGPVSAAFLQDNSFVKGIIGPVGSGKTSGCAVEVFRRGVEQPPGRDGVRRSRWLVCRNSYPRLVTTTIPSWTSWFGEKFGRINWTPPITHRIVLPLADGTVVDLEAIFVALDNPDGVAALKGFEITAAWVNEASEVPQNIVTFMLGRLGRYPARKDAPLGWHGLIMDSNNVDEDHWLAKAIEAPPEGWRFHMQPGGVQWDGKQWVENPNAENLANLPPGYYRNQMAGQSNDYIRVFLANEPGIATDGKAVYPEYVDRVHTAPEIMAPIPGAPLHLGADFGLTPALTVLQRTATGRWLAIAELVATDMGAVKFAGEVTAMLNDWFADFEIASAYGDPAGNQRAQTDEKTALAIMREITKIDWRPAPSNVFTDRREAVVGPLTRLVDGNPGLVISPACKVLRKAMIGLYQFKRVAVAGAARFHDVPDKNSYSHVAEALQYALLGNGEGPARVKSSRSQHAKRETAITDYSETRLWGRA